MRLTELLGPRINREWCPHSPFPKQLLFLQLDAFREVLYGGAAGGGKSDSLLMAFLQYADVPGYAGLILRRKIVDLERSNSILDRALKWWLPTRRTGIVYQAGKRKFIFPSGATCEFGHCQNVGDEVENYQGPEWQYIAFDELTQFVSSQYLFFWSRLRSAGVGVPLRIRGASNPGGESHNFVKNRFMSEGYARAFLDGVAGPTFEQEVLDEEGNFMRAFVPSKILDNLAFSESEAREYMQGLSQLDPTLRDRYKFGDWLVNEGGVYNPAWFRRFRHPDFESSDAGATYKLLHPNGDFWRQVFPSDCVRFMVVDPAGTSAEKKAEKAGRVQPCASAISCFDYVPDGGLLIWRNLARVMEESPEVIAAIRRMYDLEKPWAIFVEEDGIGKIYLQQLARLGLPVYAISSEGKDKLTRATPSMNEAEAGRIFLPAYAPWKDALEAELFSWQGTSAEQCDQIDTLAHAVLLKVRNRLGGVHHLE